MTDAGILMRHAFPGFLMIFARCARLQYGFAMRMAAVTMVMSPAMVHLPVQEICIRVQGAHMSEVKLACLIP